MVYIEPFSKHLLLSYLLEFIIFLIFFNLSSHYHFHILSMVLSHPSQPIVNFCEPISTMQQYLKLVDNLI